MGNKKSEIKAVVVEDAEIMLIPVQKMEEWICKYQTWKNFVFESYNIRLEEMLETIDTLAFMKMDERLYKFLTDKVKLIGSTQIENTHQEIAYNLNTSRVVISRLLKKLEKEGDELVEIISKVRQFKTSNQKPLKEEVVLTLPNKFKKSEFLQDIKSVTSAKDMKFGTKFKVEF